MKQSCLPPWIGQFFLSASAEIKSDISVGPPVVFAPDGITQPSLSGSIAMGGKVVSDAVSELVLTYNCKLNGTGLVTVQVKSLYNRTFHNK